MSRIIPSELIVHTMQFVDDLSTLKDLRLVCKRFKTVFDANILTILHLFTTNVVTLLEAIRTNFLVGHYDQYYGQADVRQGYYLQDEQKEVSKWRPHGKHYYFGHTNPCKSIACPKDEARGLIKTLQNTTLVRPERTEYPETDAYFDPIVINSVVKYFVTREALHSITNWSFGRLHGTCYDYDHKFCAEGIFDDSQPDFYDEPKELTKIRITNFKREKKYGSHLTYMVKPGQSEIIQQDLRAENKYQQGFSEDWLPSLILTDECHYEDDLPTGTWKTWYPENGQLRTCCERKKGVKFGAEQTWYASGKPLSRVMWDIEGEKTGLNESWFESGQLQYSVKWAKSDREGTETFYFETGAVRSTIQYVKGKMEGKDITYFPTGKIAKTQQWKAGKQVGLYETFSLSGQKLSSCTYENNKKHGEEKIWNQTGKLVRTGNYVMGKLSTVRDYQ